MKMNGPAEFEMKVWIVNDETGQAGQATIGLGVFEYPTPEKVAARISNVVAELEEKGMVGFRLADKQEAFNMLCEEKTGESGFAVPGGPEWDPIDQ